MRRDAIDTAVLVNEHQFLNVLLSIFPQTSYQLHYLQIPLSFHARLGFLSGIAHGILDDNPSIWLCKMDRNATKIWYAFSGGKFDESIWIMIQLMKFWGLPFSNKPNISSIDKHSISPNQSSTNRCFGSADVCGPFRPRLRAISSMTLECMSQGFFTNRSLILSILEHIRKV